MSKRKSHKQKHDPKPAPDEVREPIQSPPATTSKLKRKKYEHELRKLQGELCKLQDWVRHVGARIVVVFEGRDAAGKGGVIKRITERVSPRVFRVVALPAPSDREKSQLYMQRYIKHMPAAGEIILFDRSWYNRAGVEKVLGYCTSEQHEKFLRTCHQFEQSLVSDGILLIKYWLSVSHAEQRRRFQARIEDPRRQWKLSPTDLESVRRWYEYSLARDIMFMSTDTDYAPWHIIPSDDKRRARLNCIHHLLSRIPYEEIPRAQVTIPERDPTHQYDDVVTLSNRQVIDEPF